MRGIFLLCICGLGCADATSIWIDARVAAGDPVPASLRVSVFDVFGERVRTQLDPKRLPGSLIVSGLPDDASRPYRVVLAGTGPIELGGVRVDLVPNAQVKKSLVIASAVPDHDGDGVPDELDSCPDAADEEQLDSDGNGVGDVCAGSDQGVPGDLAPATPKDFAGSDLARSFSDGAIDAGGGSLCGNLPFLLCDGFESGFNGSLWFTRIDRRDDGGAPTVDIDTLHAYRGSHAMHAHVDPITQVGTYIQAKMRQDAVAPSPSMFVRVFLYISSSLASENTSLVSLEQETDPYGGMALEIDSGGHLFFGSYTTEPGPNVGSARTLPFDKWVCLEWQADRGPTMSSDLGTGSIRVWLDDVEVGDLHLDGLTNQPFFGSTSFGLEMNNSQALPALDLWMDEIVVDASRIGCAN